MRKSAAATAKNASTKFVVIPDADEISWQTAGIGLGKFSQTASEKLSSERFWMAESNVSRIVMVGTLFSGCMSLNVISPICCRSLLPSVSLAHFTIESNFFTMVLVAQFSAKVA